MSFRFDPKCYLRYDTVCHRVGLFKSTKIDSKRVKTMSWVTPKPTPNRSKIYQNSSKTARIEIWWLYRQIAGWPRNRLWTRFRTPKTHKNWDFSKKRRKNDEKRRFLEMRENPLYQRQIILKKGSYQAGQYSQHPRFWDFPLKLLCFGVPPKMTFFALFFGILGVFTVFGPPKPDFDPQNTCFDCLPSNPYTP